MHRCINQYTNTFYTRINVNISKIYKNLPKWEKGLIYLGQGSQTQLAQFI